MLNSVINANSCYRAKFAELKASMFASLELIYRKEVRARTSRERAERRERSEKGDKEKEEKTVFRELCFSRLLARLITTVVHRMTEMYLIQRLVN